MSAWHRDTIRRGLAAELPTARAMIDGVRALRALGYRKVETYSPFSLPAADPTQERPRSPLPRLALIGGAIGAVLGYGIQWYANVWAYPLQVGGRPSHAVPAFMLATFEAAVLGAALAVFAGLLVLLRLPEPWHPLFEIEGFERASVDRFWIAVDRRDPLFDVERTRAALMAAAPLRVVAIPESTS